jgi:hypothetical protein
MFSIDFLFHMYFLVRYCRSLEEGDFRGRTAHFVMMIIFGVTFMTLVAPFVSVHFLGSSLSFMMVYVWGRRNEDMRMSFLGVFTFNAPYLPWVMLAFSMLLGHNVTIDAIGILVRKFYRKSSCLCEHLSQQRYHFRSVTRIISWSMYSPRLQRFEDGSVRKSWSRREYFIGYVGHIKNLYIYTKINLNARGKANHAYRFEGDRGSVTFFRRMLH